MTKDNDFEAQALSLISENKVDTTKLSPAIQADIKQLDEFSKATDPDVAKWEEVDERVFNAVSDHLEGLEEEEQDEENAGGDKGAGEGKGDGTQDAGAGDDGAKGKDAGKGDEGAGKGDDGDKGATATAAAPAKPAAQTAAMPTADAGKKEEKKSSFLDRRFGRK
jgi:hypothetical protein